MLNAPHEMFSTARFQLQANLLYLLGLGQACMKVSSARASVNMPQGHMHEAGAEDKAFVARGTACEQAARGSNKGDEPERG